MQFGRKKTKNTCLQNGQNEKAAAVPVKGKEGQKVNENTRLGLNSVVNAVSCAGKDNLLRKIEVENE